VKTVSISKEEIKKDIIDQLYWDYRVDASNVKVSFDDDKIVLEGTVPSYAAKNAAEFDTWTVKGVTELRNDLTVKYPETFEVPTDEKIKEDIETSLILNYNIDSTKIDISVSNGFVTLEGTVDAFWKKLHAETIAEGVSGVISVINKIAIIPTENIVDKDIAQDIIKSLERNWRVNLDNVNVKIKNGTVELSGTVNNWDAYNAAMNAARYTIGVIDIKDDLRIASM